MGLLRSRRRPESNEKNSIINVVDNYSKIVWYFPVTDKIDAPGLADYLAKKLVLKTMGFYKSIVSDYSP